MAFLRCSLALRSSALLLLMQLPCSLSEQPFVVMGRSGYVYSPPIPAPAAVLVLHGSGGRASDMFDLGFQELAAQRGFHVVFPEMLKPKSSEWGYGDDLEYFVAVAQKLRDDFAVPSDKIFVCGHSAGGTMVTFLLNEAQEFAAGGVVEAAVGHLDAWNMTKRGARAMVIWNHADPVLTEYAPGRDEMAYYNLTVATLRRGASTEPGSVRPLPTGRTVIEAELRVFSEEPAAPELQMLSWRSDPGKHDWAQTQWTQDLDATSALVEFFLGQAVSPVVV